MDIFKAAKAKLKPPPLPPKPSHLSKQSAPNATGPSTKRGLGWPWDQPSSHFPLYTSSPSLSWIFNWELWVPDGVPESIEWVPTVRTAAQVNDIIPFLTDISTNKARPIRHFLGFNEPEIPSQANMGVDEAVHLWREKVIPAKSLFGFRLGSPGLSSDVGRSKPWMDAFLAKLGGVEGAKIDFLVVHWYGFDFGGLKWFLEEMYRVHRIPIWLNEFACSKMGNGQVSEDEVERFMRESVKWLEDTVWIERYAYFGNKDVGDWVGKKNNFTEVAPAGHEETDGKQLSRIGKLYLDL